MQQVLDREKLIGITYLVGNEDVLCHMPQCRPMQPFCSEVVEFLDVVSKKLLKLPEIKRYPDVVTFAFWIRKANVLALAEQFQGTTRRDCTSQEEDVQGDWGIRSNRESQNHIFRIGRGMLFHIAPSNVAVNYAYSLATGLIMGNTNVVRIPTKDFPQISMINRVLADCLVQVGNPLQSMICLIQYGHEKHITDAISAVVDGRIIWGGDVTISNIRQSALMPRAVEIVFADRYSIALIHADGYLKQEKKDMIAQGFYNDTYLTDQNACTSSKIVVWIGEQIAEAKKIFWEELYKIVRRKYQLQAKQVVDKLVNMYMLSEIEGLNFKKINCITDSEVEIGREDSPQKDETEYWEAGDNLITRLQVDTIPDCLMEYRGNSGFFFEYDCKDMQDFAEQMSVLCGDTRCQTLSYLGDISMMEEIVKKGIRGVDRIVPMGHTMDFDLIWDGYNLYEYLTRSVIRG